MPLALELAASWVDVLSLADMAVELQQGLDLLETDMQDIPERHRSIRAAINYSWQKLDKKEQDIFAGLSVFRGGFSREAAQAVVGANLRQLAQLVSKSWLQGGGVRGDGRYQVHELLRQYGAEKLSENEQETAVRDQHATYYCTEVGKRFSDLRGPGQQMALAQIEVDKENMHEAWSWAAQQKNWLLLHTAANALNWFYLLQGRYEEGDAICREVTGGIQTIAFSRVSNAISLRILAQILAWQGNFEWILGDREGGIAHLQLSLTLLEKQPQHDQQVQLTKAHALHILGLYADMYDADLDSAREWMQKSLELYRNAENKWGEAWCLRYLGNTLQKLNFKDIAKEHLERSLNLFKAIGDTIEIAMSLSFLCYRAIAEGEYKEAERLGQESLLSNELIGSSFGKAQSMNVLGWTVLPQGRLPQADSYFQEVLKVTRDMGDIFNSFPAIIGQSCIQLHKGNYELARTLAQEDFALTRSHNRYNRYFLSALGDVALALGEYDVARRYLQQTMDIFVSGEEHFLIESLGALGVTLLRLGKMDEARQHLYEAFQLALHIRSYSMPFLLAGIAVFLSEQGHEERAIALYALAEKHPLIAQSRWFADVYGRSVAMKAAALPPLVIETARAQGQKLDLWQTAESLLTELAELGWGDD
jgi:tetratricopeptide (TPR) repeat protein